MIIAVAALDKNEDADISSRSGRAPYFLLFDEAGNLLDSLKNPFAVGGGGAGIATAKLLSDRSADIFVAGQIGGKMEEALKERGVRFQEKQGKAKNAVKELAS